MIQLQPCLFRSIDDRYMCAFRRDASGTVTHLFPNGTTAFEKISWYETARCVNGLRFRSQTACFGRLATGPLKGFVAGVFVALAEAGWFCCRKYRVDFWLAADLVVVTAPIGLGLGRLGNFINGELYGRVASVPWAMVFPGGGPLPRHPSQLYEFGLEGVLLFAILWIAKDRRHARGMMTALILMLYGLFRFLVEFFREPDAQLGFIAGPFTMGQALSAVTFAAGLVLYVVRRKAAEE